MTTLIIGGAGFLGRAIIEQLRERDRDVVSADVDPEQAFDDEDVTTARVDVTDYEQLNGVIEDYGPDRVVHLAYIGAVSDRFPSKAARVNCVGFDNVLRAAAEHSVSRVVYASSAALYGIPGTYTDPVDEDVATPAAYTQYPSMLYSAMKQLNEYQSRLYADTHDMEVAAVRPAFIFGPGYDEGYTKWASDLVANPLRGATVTIPFPPDQQLPLVYRDDAARLFVEVLEAPALSHHSYNTGCYAITPRELAEAVEEAVGGTVSWDESADPAPFVEDVACDRASDEFGYSLRSLNEAIDHHVESVQAG